MPNCRLQAVVVIYPVKPVPLQTNWSEPQIRYASAGVLNRVGVDPVDGGRRAGQLGEIHIVAIVPNVDAAGSDIGDFQNVRSDKLILQTQVVLADKRRLDVFIEG